MPEGPAREAPDRVRWVDYVVTELRTYLSGEDVRDSDLRQAGLDPADPKALGQYLERQLSDPDGDWLGDSEGMRRECGFVKDQHAITVTVIAP